MAGIDRRIDLNADVGASFGRWQLGDASAMMPSLTSANVACGFHAGDPLTPRRTVRDAPANSVAVWAQAASRARSRVAATGGSAEGGRAGSMARGGVAEGYVRRNAGGWLGVGRERGPRPAGVGRLDRRASGVDLQPPRRCEEDKVRLVRRGADV